jgi:hypothetical protein
MTPKKDPAADLVRIQTNDGNLIFRESASRSPLYQEAFESASLPSRRIETNDMLRNAMLSTQKRSEAGLLLGQLAGQLGSASEG